jgi:hypothetical protein
MALISLALQIRIRVQCHHHHTPWQRVLDAGVRKDDRSPARSFSGEGEARQGANLGGGPE